MIRCLLIVPFPESSLNDEAGKLFMESYDEYFRRAKLMTSVHALKKTSADSSGSSTDATASDSGSSAAAAAASSAQSAADTGKATKAKVVKKKALKRL